MPNKIIEVVERVERGNRSQITVEKLFEKLLKLQIKGNYYFRGISKHNQYFPKVFREFDKKRRNNQLHGFLEEYEIQLLKEFSKYSINYLPNINEYLDWIASAQHFGLATRLIDWTKNPFIGLYFSVFYNDKQDVNNNSIEEDEYYRLLVVDKNKHISFSINPELKPEAYRNQLFINNEYIKNFIYLCRYLSNDKDFKIPLNKDTDEGILYNELNKNSVKNLNKLIFFEVNNSNLRIIAQNGLFEIPRSTEKMDMGFELTERNIEKYHIIYKFHKELRREILDRLKKMNITSVSLFPDLQNICDYINSTIWVDEETI